MKCLRVTWFVSAIACLLLAPAPSAVAQVPVAEQAPPALVANAPAHGTFYLLGRIPSPPFPLDPYYGTLPVYAYDGVYFVDNTGEELFFESESGGMMSMSMSPPCDPCMSNSATNLCNSLTNFVVNYLYAATTQPVLGIAPTTNPWIALTIQTATTDAPYDVFGTTNLAELALPSLSRTNWVWRTRANGGMTNFLWGETNWCERYFQLGTTNDLDDDGLTTAFEFLVSHTGTNTWDTDGDGIGDGAEVFFSLNPRVSDPAFTITITQPTPGVLP